jgi:DivIVA domain-containing protein
MPLTPEDVQGKRFSTVRFKEGYDEEEVDAFLDDVEAELRRLLGENAELRRTGPPAEVQPAPSALTPAPPPEETNEAALRTLLLAQRTGDEAIAQAKSEAEQIVATARVRATSLESQAQQQHAAAMSELQRQRQLLEAAIERLRGFERDYRTRLKAYLESQLRDLEARTAEPPTAAGAPPPPPATAPVDTPIPMAAPVSPAPPSAARPTGPQPNPPVAPPSPFAPGRRPLVEDVDAGSDAPAGPPREPDAGTGDFDASGDAST